MAGMPNQVVIRANEILHFLEKDKKKTSKTEKMASLPKPSHQMMLFESDPRFARIADKLNEIDINTIAPVEALLRLNELQRILDEEDQKIG